MKLRRIRICTPAVALLALAPLALAAGKTVPGEKWQQNITMQMQGMSMPMGTHEVCAPAGKPTELLKPEKNCAVTNLRQSGNKTSADIKCTGKDAIEGSVEQIVEGNHVRGTMHMHSGEGDMTMKIDSQKLGACQAVDTDELVADAQKASASAVQAVGKAAVASCAKSESDLKKDPGQTGLAAMMFVADGGPCASKPTNAGFCAAVQTRAGFSNLMQTDTAMKGIAYKSLAACNLGQGKPAADALRSRLIASAETDGDAGFLETNAPARLKEIARTQCVPKGEMWGGRTPKWDSFCDSDFAAKSRGR
jgi:hypothetical protein